MAQTLKMEIRVPFCRHQPASVQYVSKRISLPPLFMRSARVVNSPCTIYPHMRSYVDLLLVANLVLVKKLESSSIALIRRVLTMCFQEALGSVWFTR
jgi:hypothetical protein